LCKRRKTTARTIRASESGNLTILKIEQDKGRWSQTTSFRALRPAVLGVFGFLRQVVGLAVWYGAGGRNSQKTRKMPFFYGHLKVVKTKGGGICREEKQGKDRCLASS